MRTLKRTHFLICYVCGTHAIVAQSKCTGNSSPQPNKMRTNEFCTYLNRILHNHMRLWFLLCFYDIHSRTIFGASSSSRRVLSAGVTVPSATSLSISRSRRDILSFLFYFIRPSLLTHTLYRVEKRSGTHGRRWHMKSGVSSKRQKHIDREPICCTCLTSRTYAL